MAGLALFIGAMAGAITRSVPIWIGTTFLAFVVIVAINPWFSRRFSRKDENLESEAKTVASELSRSRTALAYNPDLAPSQTPAVLTKEETIALYSRSFDIGTDKARSLYDAGYTRWGDLQEAIPQDLIQVQGINPTVAKRITSTVRTKRP